MEAAVEAARQLRLRDLAGLIVIDFIDMDESKNNRTVEKVLKDALAKDRARIQMGRISGFGLMEISRQRRRLGVIEGATEACPHCQGAGRVRSAESAALMTLRALDIEAGKNGAGSVNLRLCTAVGLYILNHKRDYLQRLLAQRGLNVVILIDDSLGQGEHALERTETNEDFVPEERPDAFIDLDDDFDDSAYDDEDDSDDEFIAEDEDDDDDEAGDSDDEAGGERPERTEGENSRGRGRRRRGGRRDGAEAVAEDGPASAPALAAREDDDDSESGRRRRRGRRGGRRVREEGGERDGFTWVRGRTPSLEDPYVWFDPINPERTEAPSDIASTTPSDDVEEVVGERPDGEPGGERTGRSRRRRGRGRGRDRGGDQGLTHEVKVETRATNEGMPADGSPDTPMAVFVEEAADVAPVAIAEEPKRRRVRRKVSASATSASALEPVSTVEPNEAEPVGQAAVLDVMPAEAALSTPEPEAAPMAAAIPAPTPEIDVGAMIAEDPAQIVAPPEKPKRGWWRR
jgi:ribonuclease E